MKAEGGRGKAGRKRRAGGASQFSSDENGTVTFKGRTGDEDTLLISAAIGIAAPPEFPLEFQCYRGAVSERLRLGDFPLQAASTSISLFRSTGLLM